MKPYSLHTQETLNGTARVYKSRFHRSYSEKQATTNPEREKRVSDLPLIIDVVLQTIKFSRYKTHRTIEPQGEPAFEPSLPAITNMREKKVSDLPFLIDVALQTIQF